jgi:pimeloyl-ACP methyl ester carboxylesterase
MAATRPDDQRVSRFVTVDRVRFHALDWGGDGPPLVLVHGGRRTGRSWNAVARRLHDSFRVIALDTRGHGETDAPPTGYGTWQRTYDTAAVLEALEIEPHFVMAHSLGGGSSALYAAMYPDRVRGMILIEPVPEGPQHWVRVGVLDEQMNPIEERGRRNAWPSLDDLRRRLSTNEMTKVWTPEVLEDVLREETIVHPDGRAEARWSLNFYNMEEIRQDAFSLLDEAPKMTMPVMVMAAANNRLLESHLAPLAKALPHGELVVLEGVGHAIYMEAPDVVASYARRFFLGQDAAIRD